MNTGNESSDSEFGDLAAAIGTVGSPEASDNEDSDSEVEEQPQVEKPKRRKINPIEEGELDKFLFGDKTGLIQNLEGNKVFFTDVTGEQDPDDKQPRQAVWDDYDSDDDDRTLADAQLKRKFERTTDSNRPGWADLDRKKASDDESDEEVSKHLSKASSSTSKDLPKGELSFKRLKDVNNATNKEGRITALEFHPQSTVGIVAGAKGLVSMFAIDGRENKK